jgi:hypothetical protein
MRRKGRAGASRHFFKSLWHSRGAEAGELLGLA